jgi:hypothetical protein
MRNSENCSPLESFSPLQVARFDAKRRNSPPCGAARIVRRWEVRCEQASNARRYKTNTVLNYMET